MDDELIDSNVIDEEDAEELSLSRISFLSLIVRVLQRFSLFEIESLLVIFFVLGDERCWEVPSEQSTLEDFCEDLGDGFKHPGGMFESNEAGAFHIAPPAKNKVIFLILFIINYHSI